MRQIIALVIILVVPPVLAALISAPFSYRAYVFIAAFLGFTVVAIPVAMTFWDRGYTAKALASGLKEGVRWLAWYVAAVAGFAALVCLMLLAS